MNVGGLSFQLHQGKLILKRRVNTPRKSSANEEFRGKGRNIMNITFAYATIPSVLSWLNMILSILILTTCLVLGILASSWADWILYMRDSIIEDEWSTVCLDVCQQASWQSISQSIIQIFNKQWIVVGEENQGRAPRCKGRCIIVCSNHVVLLQNFFFRK